MAVHFIKILKAKELFNLQPLLTAMMFLAIPLVYIVSWSVTLGSVAATNSNIYYVRTKASLCPATSNSYHCQTLDFYGKNKSFESNRTFMFLSGIHTLSQEIIITGIKGLSLLGSQNICQIICANKSAGFAFFSTVDLRISKLEIHGCSIQRQDYVLAGAVIIDNALNTSINELTVTNTTGGVGLRAINSRGLLSITNSLFAHNRYDSHWKGGNVKIFFDCINDEYSPRDVLIKNTVFKHGAESYRETETDGCGGLTIAFNCYNVKVHIEDSIMDSNSGYFGANIVFVIILLSNNSVTINNVTSCYGHSDGQRGAGLFVILTNSIGTSDKFTCDRQKYITKENQLLNFSGLYIHGNQGSGFDIEDRTYPDTDCVSQYALIQDSILSNNTSPSWWGGTALRFGFIPTRYILKSFNLVIATFKYCTFQNNHAYTPGNIAYTSSAIYFELVKKVIMEDCFVGNNTMTGIQGYSSNIYFRGNISIYSNSNFYGGGLLLLQSSFMYLTKNTHIDFRDNHAKSVGGALFNDFDFQIPTRCPCFYQLDITGNDDDNFIDSIKVYFHNNTAEYAGSAIFGGVTNNCRKFSHSSSDYFDRVFQIENTVSDPSAISSDPYYVCFCQPNNLLPNCTIESHNVSVFPGDNFHISAATVGSNKAGSIQGVVHSKFLTNYPDTSFGSLQIAQNSGGKYCTHFNYTISTMEKFVGFSLQTDKLDFFSTKSFSAKTVNVILLDCPPGFELYTPGGQPKCDCEKQLQENKGIKCLITTQEIVPPPGSWVGYVNKSTANSSGAIFYRYCPYYYCHSEQLHISLNNTDMQCSSNRTGILCGQCQEGLSLTLGRNQCMKCSTVNILYILIFALMGVALVVLLFILRLTVTEGSINGLIFYANIVKMNQSLLLPGNRINFLSVFIAWMNMDLGIDLCLFDGMNSVYKTILQFAFPIYIWLLVILVIFMANRNKLIANIVSERAVQVLATLLLFSYTKLQRVIVTIFTYTTLNYPDGTQHNVWLFDGNIAYLQGQHVILLAIGTVFFILFLLPYTVLLTFFKFFQAHSDWKILSWVNKIKPAIDAYAGPYKDNFRFWTGFLLCSRTAILLLLTLNQTNSPAYNLYTTGLIAIGLITLVSSVGGIYNNRLYNFLECISYSNTAVVASTLLFSTGFHCAILNVSMGVSFAMFLAIVLIHLYKYTPLKACMNRIKCKQHNTEVEIEENFPIDRDEEDGASLLENVSM